MRKFSQTLICLLITACHGIGETGSGVSYKSVSGLPCPPPVLMPHEVAAGFSQYDGDPLMMNFYKHYLEQQRQLAAFAQRNPSTPNCPTAFWVEDGVAAQFRHMPAGHPMREWFKTYAAQQRALDAYYSPNAGAR